MDLELEVDNDDVAVSLDELTLSLGAFAQVSTGEEEGTLNSSHCDSKDEFLFGDEGSKLPFTRDTALGENNMDIDDETFSLQNSKDVAGTECKAEQVKNIYIRNIFSSHINLKAFILHPNKSHVF